MRSRPQKPANVRIKPSLPNLDSRETVGWEENDRASGTCGTLTTRSERPDIHATGVTEGEKTENYPNVAKDTNTNI